MAKASAEERKRIVDLYLSGLTLMQVAREVHRKNEVIRKVVEEEGVFDKYRAFRKPQEVKRTNFAKPHTWYDQNKIQTAITRKDCLKARIDTKVGDVLMVRTEKAFSLNVDDKETKDKRSGVVRKAVVINTDNPRFCIVELREGVTEMILWSDIVRYRRGDAKFIDN